MLAGARVVLFGIDICSLPCAVWMAKHGGRKSQKDRDDRDEDGDGGRFYAAEQARAKKILQHNTASNEHHEKRKLMSEDEGEKSEGTGEEGGRKASGREGGRGGGEVATSRVASSPVKLSSQKLPMKRKVSENPMAADAAASRHPRKVQVSCSPSYN